jgi:phage gp36-like protein
MGNYIEPSDIESSLSDQEVEQLVEDDAPLDGEVNVATNETVLKKIESAESQVDSYLRERYKVPIQNPPAVIKEIALTITVYRLKMRRSFVEDPVRADYEDAMKRLEAFAEGRATLPGSHVEEGADDAFSGFAETTNATFDGSQFI